MHTTNYVPLIRKKSGLLQKHSEPMGVNNPKGRPLANSVAENKIE